MSFVAEEIASQPDCWRAAAQSPGLDGTALPAEGERVAFVGCGTSWFMAQAMAGLREAAGHGESDAFAASEMPGGRDYDRLILLSRSGTTTEVLQVAQRMASRARTTAVTADADSPMVDEVDETIALGFADERSVVQTRFATTALALFRAHLGTDIEPVAEEAKLRANGPLPEEALAADQITFLGTGWTIGLALEAALKCREAAQAWTEAYPAMEYRHGPMSISTGGRVVWVFGAVPDGLSEAVKATGATLVTSDVDPLADLVRAQRVAVALAEQRGLDPDRPRHLARSVILEEA